MIDCPDLVFARSSTPSGILETHALNMQTHAICVSRYNALRTAVKLREMSRDTYDPLFYNSK